MFVGRVLASAVPVNTVQYGLCALAREFIESIDPNYDDFVRQLRLTKN
jgi:hypothetical protein